MIKVLKEGRYKLVETKKHAKVIYLDGEPYVWFYVPKVGHILETKKGHHKTDYTLVVGRYRLYDVKGSPRYTENKHLELFVGNGLWQGYILPAGLKHKRIIIPTNEIISSPAIP